jgi:hypothetical protein
MAGGSTDPQFGQDPGGEDDANSDDCASRQLRQPSRFGTARGQHQKQRQHGGKGGQDDDEIPELHMSAVSTIVPGPGRVRGRVVRLKNMAEPTASKWPVETSSLEYAGLSGESRDGRWCHLSVGAFALSRLAGHFASSAAGRGLVACRRKALSRSDTVPTSRGLRTGERHA